MKWVKTINVKITSDYTRSFGPLKADILEKPDIKAKCRPFRLLGISTHGADLRSKSPRGPQRSGSGKPPPLPDIWKGCGSARALELIQEVLLCVRSTSEPK